MNDWQALRGAPAKRGLRALAPSEPLSTERSESCGRRFGGQAREFDFSYCSTVEERSRKKRQTRPMKISDFSADRQSQARAGRFRREEGLEDFRTNGWLDSHSFVQDPNDDRVGRNLAS